MVTDKIKLFIRKYPGLILAVSVGQMFLSILFLWVIFYDNRTVSLLRSAAEKRAEAEFASELHQMELAAEADDLTDDRKKLILYGKAEAAMERLAETGYNEKLKRTVTQALNGICRHLLEGPMTEEILSSEERSFIHLFGELNTEEAYRRFTPDGANFLSSARMVGDAERTRHFSEIYASQKDVERFANRLFGIEGVLEEKKGVGERTRLFSCKNAYAVMNAMENYPLEAVIFLPPGEDVYTVAECTEFAKRLIEDVYPNKITRRLSLLGESDGEGYGETVFGSADGSTLTIRISKSSGKMISLRTEAAGKNGGLFR